MGQVITVYDYCQALRAWAVTTNVLLDAEIGWVYRFCEQVREKFDLNEMHPIAEICAYAEECEISDDVRLAAHKSCLLGRLLYGGEKVRTKPCPIHKGRWSGCVPYLCEGGCNFGSNLTGWIAE